MKPPPKRQLTFVSLLSSFVVAAVVAPRAVFAQIIDVSSVVGRNPFSPSVDQYALLLTLIARAALGLFGFILFCRVVWGLFLLATHGGSSDAQAEAVETVKGAAIGVLAVAVALPLVGFLIGAVARTAGNLANLIA